MSILDGKPYCQSCGTKRFLRINSRSKWREYYLCKDCATARMKKYRKTKNGKQVTSNLVNKYKRNNPEKVSAWAKTKKLDNKPCEICGKEPTHKHHPNYKKPLFIIYLCPYHHAQAHKVT